MRCRHACAYVRMPRYLAALAVGVAMLVLPGLARAANTCATTTSAPLPTRLVTVVPNTTEASDLKSGFNFMWNNATSPTTPLYGPNGRDYGRVINVQKQPDWWYAADWYVDPSFSETNHGNWGVFSDYHNVPGDVGWGYGSGVSPVALDWDAQPVLRLEYQPGSLSHIPFPFVKGAWQSVLMHVVFGRTDSSTSVPGSVQLWVNGVKAIDVQSVNTLQRALNPSTGGYETQKWVELWDGFYTQNTQTTVKVQHTLQRMGTSLQATLDDRPTLVSSWGSVYSGSGTNYGNSTTAAIASRTTDQFVLPQEFRCGAAAPASTAVPTIGGTAEVGQTLTATTGSWSGSPTAYSYQWRRCEANGDCAVIAGATASSYKLVAADAGKSIRVAVTATSPQGSATAVSAASATVQAAPVIQTPLPSGVFTTSVTQGATLNAPYEWTFDPGVPAVAGYFWADGTLLGKVSGPPPYRFTLPTGLLASGAHRLGHSWDLADGTRKAPPSAFSVTIVNQGVPNPPAPSPVFTAVSSIAGGQTLSGKVRWTATVAGATASRVEFYVDGTLATTERIAPYCYLGDEICTLDTTKLANGGHTLVVKAFADGGLTAAATAAVTVGNGPTFAASSSIAGGQTLSGKVRWTATVSGATASRVEFYVDGTLATTERIAPYCYLGDEICTLDTTKLANGGHTLVVKAFADGGLTAVTTAGVTVKNG